LTEFLNHKKYDWFYQCFWKPPGVAFGRIQKRMSRFFLERGVNE